MPVRVQGDGAALEIAEGIRRAGLRRDVEVIVTGRGGGSVEDLWAFNEEPVARAIFASPVPVIAAIGHETDATLADEVADVRAATPSHAGQLVVPVLAELDAALASALERGPLGRSARIAQRARTRLDSCGPAPGARDPARAASTPARRGLDEAARRLREALLGAPARPSATRSRSGRGCSARSTPPPSSGAGSRSRGSGEGAARRLVRDGSEVRARRGHPDDASPRAATSSRRSASPSIAGSRPVRISACQRSRRSPRSKRSSTSSTR